MSLLKSDWRVPSDAVPETEREAFRQANENRYRTSLRAVSTLIRELRPLMKDNPRLSALAGSAAHMECKRYRLIGEIEDAVRACKAALAAGESISFYVDTLKILAEAGDYDEAKKVALAAMRFGPDSRSILSTAGYVMRLAGDPVVAANAYKRLALLRPASEADERNRNRVASILRVDGYRFMKQGQVAEAVARFALGAELAPIDKDMRERLEAATAILHSGDHLEPQPFDEYSLRVELDRAMSGRKRADLIVYMWDDYILRHPGEAEAHRERAGALWNWGWAKVAIEESEVACELGSQAACNDLPRMRARFAKYLENQQWAQ